MASSPAGIECAGLTRSFGGRAVLSCLDLRVEAGSLAVLLGSNGAGKTTLLKILATLLLPSGGRASILGRDVLRDPGAVRGLLGFSPAEERSFYARLTVAQNLEFFGALRGLSARESQARAAGPLAELGLEDQVRSPFGALSSGMKQSLSLVRALLHGPPVLVLDEPTRSLSPDLALRAQQLLRRLVREEGRTILLATHNLMEAEALADQVALLHRGRLLIQGAPDGLFQDAGLHGPGALEALYRQATGAAGEVES